MSLSQEKPLLAGPPAETSGRSESRTLRRVLRENGLSLVLFGLFALFLAGQSVTGWLEYNSDAKEHHQPAISFPSYFMTGHFMEATFENWESEFLQMAAYVVLTTCLVQKGSSESRPPDEKIPQDEDPAEAKDRPDAPGPVKKGGLALRLYSHSLSLALVLFFLLSFAGHVVGGARVFSQEQIEHGEHAVSALQYLGTSRLWFESFQNWQSEFLAVFSIVVLSIFLRERHSPESKPVAAPHMETGTD